MTKRRIFLIATALMLSACAHIVAASFWRETSKDGALDNGRGGLVVSLGSAGKAPGGVSAVKTNPKAQADESVTESAAPPGALRAVEAVTVAEKPETAIVNAEHLNWDVAVAAMPELVPRTAPLAKTLPPNEKVDRGKEAVSSVSPKVDSAAKMRRPRPPMKKPTRPDKPVDVAPPVRRKTPPLSIPTNHEEISVPKSTEGRAPGEDALPKTDSDTRSSEATGDTLPVQLASLTSGQGGRTGEGGETETGDGDNTLGGGTPGARADYFAQLQDWLEQHKRYPRRAKLRRQQGVALLRFVVMRDGSISEFEVEKSSGHSLLDTEVRNLMVRAQPLPSIPKSVPNTRIELFIPIKFSLN